MPFAGFIWGTIICVPFWLIVILFVKTGIIAMETIIFVGLVLSGLLLFLILTSPQNTKQDEQDQQLFSPATKARPFYNMKMEFKLADNGGTRKGVEIGENFIIQPIFRREDRVWTVEKDLTAEI